MENQNLKVWCLLIDHNCKAVFGEPFAVSNIHPDDTIYDLKIKIKSGLKNDEELNDELSGLRPNKMEIWMCNPFTFPKLFAYNSFGQTKKVFDRLKFTDDRFLIGHVYHLGVAKSVAELPLESDELLFVRRID